MSGGTEWYLHQVCGGTLLGPRACRSERQWNQHLRRWQDLGPSQRQARDVISGPNRGTRAKCLFLSREQARVVTGLLTGHKTLYRHLHLMGLRDSPLCRKCGTEDETCAHILCKCEALASGRHAHLGSLFLEPEDIKHTNLGAIWRFGKVAGLLWGNNWGTKSWIIYSLSASGPGGPEPSTNLSIYLSITGRDSLSANSSSKIARQPTDTTAGTSHFPIVSS
jgi:hypothetical protein